MVGEFFGGPVLRRRPEVRTPGKMPIPPDSYPVYSKPADVKLRGAMRPLRVLQYSRGLLQGSEPECRDN